MPCGNDKFAPFKIYHEHQFLTDKINEYCNFKCKCHVKNSGFKTILITNPGYFDKLREPQTVNRLQ